MRNVKSITADELRSKLANGVVRFFFEKKDGSLREAIGTTQLGAIPTESHPSGQRQSPPSVVPFFDIEKGQWRCVSVTKKMWS